MNRNYKALAYLMAANFEAVAVFVSAWYIGEWLTVKYPEVIDWFIVTFSVAIVVVVHSWYRLFVSIKKDFYKS